LAATARPTPGLRRDLRTSQIDIAFHTGSGDFNEICGRNR